MNTVEYILRCSFWSPTSVAALLPSAHRFWQAINLESDLYMRIVHLPRDVVVYYIYLTEI